MRKLVPALLAAAALAACSSTSPDVVQRGDAQRLSQVQDAVVLNVRTITVDGSQSGAVAGAVAGNAIERAATREEAVEILLQLKNGERRSVVQAKGSEMLAVGDPVIIVTTGDRARVMKAPPGATGAPAPVYSPTSPRS